MKKIGYILLSAIFVFACNKADTGPSAFEVEWDEQTLLFSYGEQKEIPYVGEHLEVLTAKAPNGWKSSVSDGRISVTAPEAGTAGDAVSGRVGIYARGTDKFEYALYIPVRSESPQNKASWEIVYCSSASEGNGPENLFDGSVGSFWSAGAKSPQYIIIDFGSVRSITGVGFSSRIRSEEPFLQCAEAVVDFATEVRGDGMADLGGTGTGDWGDKHTFYSDRLANRAFNMVHLNGEVSARYMRLRYHKHYLEDGSVSQSGAAGASLSEIDIYGY